MKLARNVVGALRKAAKMGEYFYFLYDIFRLFSLSCIHFMSLINYSQEQNSIFCLCQICFLSTGSKFIRRSYDHRATLFYLLRKSRYFSLSLSPVSRHHITREAVAFASQRQGQSRQENRGKEKRLKTPRSTTPTTPSLSATAATTAAAAAAAAPSSPTWITSSPSQRTW